MISAVHLWFTLIGLYFLESIRVVAPGTVIFRRRLFNGSWFWRGRFGSLESGRRGWMLAPLLPGADPDIIAQDFTLAYDDAQVSPNSLFVVNDQKAIRYSDIETVGTDGRYLLINGARYLYFQTNSEARSAEENIDRLRKMAKDTRDEAISKFVNLAFARVAAERLREFRVITRTVKILAGTLWLVIFAGFPAVFLVGANDMVLVPLGALIWLLAVAAAIAATIAQKRITPPGRHHFPWTALRYIFYPVAALRACDDLAENVFTGLHPATICVDLCRNVEQTECLRYLLLRSIHRVALSGAGGEEADAVSGRFGSLMADRIKKELTERAPKVLKTLIPERSDEASVSYCPRCQAQYRIASGNCADCPGVMLQRFTPLGIKKVRK